mgnify:CR=1 FL=1
MRIVKRKYAQPISTITIVLIPLFTYVLGKAGMLVYNEYEWVWWITIPTLFVLWLVINFKTKRKMSEQQLTERERSIIFHSRNCDYRMNNWTPEEQHDKAGIPRLRSELTDNDKTFLLLNQNKDE